MRSVVPLGTKSEVPRGAPTDGKHTETAESGNKLLHDTLAATSTAASLNDASLRCAATPPVYLLEAFGQPSWDTEDAADQGVMAENIVIRAPSTSNSPISVVADIKIPVGVAEDLHELRVRISSDLHRQLLSLKVLRGRSLAETVSLALGMYFEEVRSAHSTRVDVKEVSPAA